MLRACMDRVMNVLLRIWKTYITPILDEVRGLFWALLGPPMTETDEDFRRLLRGGNGD